MVQLPFFVGVAMIAIFSIVHVQAIPISVNIEPRAPAKKFAKDLGKELYSQIGNAVLHGASLPGTGPSVRQGMLRTPTFTQPAPPEPLRPLNRPLIKKLEMPNLLAQEPSIGPVTAALREKARNQQSESAVKFDQKKVGLAKEAPAGKPSPKVQVGGKPKAKEAPF